MEENNNATDIVKGNSKRNEFISGVITFFCAAAIIILIRIFLVDIAYVNGESMMNTISDNDRVLFVKLGEPEAGDIVVVNTDDDSKLIKRVIATEGDTVEIKRGELYINDTLQTESYIKEKMNDYDFSKITVSENEIFVLGDNRNYSADSRYYGTFDLEDDYVGRVFFQWSPLFK